MAMSIANKNAGKRSELLSRNKEFLLSLLKTNEIVLHLSGGWENGCPEKQSTAYFMVYLVILYCRHSSHLITMSLSFSHSI